MPSVASHTRGPEQQVKGEGEARRTTGHLSCVDGSPAPSPLPVTGGVLSLLSLQVLPCFPFKKKQSGVERCGPSPGGSQSVS